MSAPEEFDWNLATVWETVAEELPDAFVQIQGERSFSFHEQRAIVQFDSAHIAYVFTLRLRPGETRALVTFVVKGLSEVYDPRGGYPIPYKDALTTGEAVYAGSDAKIPAAGSEIKRVTDIAAQLVKAPDLRGLSVLQRSQISNWNNPAPFAYTDFSVFEKTVPELQAAMTSGGMTSEVIGPPERRGRSNCNEDVDGVHALSSVSH